MKRLCMGCMNEYDDRYNICPYCGYIHNTPALQACHMTPGSILNKHYIVGRVLSFGDLCVTYIGWDYMAERKITIKEYFPSDLVTRKPAQTQVTAYPGEKQKQFRLGTQKIVEEAERMAQAGETTGVTQIYDCFEENGTAYIVMEYLEGITLKRYLEENGTMTVEQALPIIVQIASSMDVIHREGIPCREIVPDNIYVLNPNQPDNLQVKLIEFSDWKYVRGESEDAGHGNHNPEQDIYSLVKNFFHLLTGSDDEKKLQQELLRNGIHFRKHGMKALKKRWIAVTGAATVLVFGIAIAGVRYIQLQSMPAASGETDYGTDITVYSSEGKKTETVPFITGAEETETEIYEVKVVVPDLAGCSQEELEALLKEAGLKLNIIEVLSEEPEGTMLEQNPVAGEEANRGSYVTVCISIGQEEIYMSDLELMSLEEAKKELAIMGLTVGTVTEEYSETITKGKVISQSIDWGAAVKKGTAVDLVISFGKMEPEQSEVTRKAKKSQQAAEASRETVPSSLEASKGAVEGSAETKAPGTMETEETVFSEEELIFPKI